MPWECKPIAQKIVESEADYVLALKRNRRHLSEDLKRCFYRSLYAVYIQHFGQGLWAGGKADLYSA